LKGKSFTVFTPGDFAKAISQLERLVATPSPPPQLLPLPLLPLPLLPLPLLPLPLLR
jgi:hypothetical protein